LQTLDERRSVRGDVSDEATSRSISPRVRSRDRTQARVEGQRRAIVTPAGSALRSSSISVSEAGGIEERGGGEIEPLPRLRLARERRRAEDAQREAAMLNRRRVIPRCFAMR